MKNKIILVLGTTGAGKSRLGIDLSLNLQSIIHSEIISADSMQVYKGFDIGSAKITLEDRKLVTHHGIDIVEPCYPFTVKDYQSYCKPIINKLHLENKMPLVVGGTLYYVESLLWNNFLSIKNNINDIEVSQNEIKNKLLDDQQLDPYEKLQILDPVMAKRLHPHDLRKINRSLEVYQQYGIPHSELIISTGETQGSECLYDCLLFWLSCEDSILIDRLNKRVDSMITDGLLDEVKNIYPTINKNPKIGINQAIGFKEFLPYLKSQQKSSPLEMDHIISNCINEIKKNTISYSHRQTKWFNNRLIQSIPLIYNFDTSNPLKYQEEVLKPATEIAIQFLSNQNPSILPLTHSKYQLNMASSSLSSHKRTLNEWQKYYCDSCDRILNGDNEWQVHLTSRKHHRRLSKLKKLREANHEEVPFHNEFDF